MSAGPEGRVGDGAVGALVVCTGGDGFCITRVPRLPSAAIALIAASSDEGADRSGRFSGRGMTRSVAQPTKVTATSSTNAIDRCSGVAFFIN